MRNFCLFFIVLLIGCSKTTQDDTNHVIKEQVPYVLSFNQTTTLNTLEPADGILLGAYFEESPNFMIKEFEQKLVKNPNHYVYEYTLGTTFDTNKILECIATNRTLYLKIFPNNYSAFSLTDIASVSNIINAFNIDCYIELFPNPTTQNFSPDIYIDYFVRSSNILKQSKRDISIIFTPSKDNLLDSEKFCPPLKSFDFIGFEYIGYVQNKNTEIYEDFFIKFDYIYKTFQNKKPIFITTFALSNYSNRFNTYYINENINYINEIFNKLSNNYPMVKAVNFYNINSKDSPFFYNIYNNDDYTFTENLELLSNFNKLISNEYFYSSLIPIDSKLSLQKYNYDALLYENEYYISKNIETNSFLTKLSISDYYIYEFDNKAYFKLSDIKEELNEYQTEIDTIHNIIKLYN